METFFWMLGEFASLKSKHDGGVASAKIKLSKTVQYGRSLFPQCALDATGFLSDVYKRNTRAKKLQADDVQCGKSMIEMLGVLAIIGVLSVGGIAGYSKAMEKYKLNKMVDEYNNITFSLIENYQSILAAADAPNNGEVPLYQIIKDLKIFPDNWKPYYKNNRVYMDDGYNNLANYFVRYNSTQKISSIYLDLHLGTNVGNLSVKGSIFPSNTCVALFTDWLQPMSNVILKAGIYSTNNKQASSSMLQGKTSCAKGDKCLASATLSDIHNMCNTCQEDKVQCYVAIQFEGY